MNTTKLLAVLSLVAFALAVVVDIAGADLGLSAVGYVAVGLGLYLASKLVSNDL